RARSAYNTLGLDLRIATFCRSRPKVSEKIVMCRPTPLLRAAGPLLKGSAAVWLGWALAALLFAPSAVPHYGFGSWTTDTGLPQNSVTAMCETRDGYLWVATFDGLARFDGVRFTVFDRSTSPGITNNRFTTLYEDARGDLWMGTESSGVTRYHQGRFTAYGTDRGVPQGVIRCFAGDAAGNVWVVSDDWIRQWQVDDERFVEAA